MLAYEILKPGVDAMIFREGKEDKFARLFLQIVKDADAISKVIERTNQTTYFLLISDLINVILSVSDQYLDYRLLHQDIDSTIRKFASIIVYYDNLSRFEQKQDDLVKIRDTDPIEVVNAKNRLKNNLASFFQYIRKNKEIYDSKNTPAVVKSTTKPAESTFTLPSKIPTFEKNGKRFQHPANPNGVFCDLNKNTIAVLKQVADSLGVKISGKKADMVTQLEAVIVFE